MPLAIDGEVIEIGAMNPSFPKLIEYIDEIKDLHEIEAKLFLWMQRYGRNGMIRMNNQGLVIYYPARQS